MRVAKLVDAIVTILQHSIAQGGTTLRDFINPGKQPGYFQQQLWVYGRAGQACRQCGSSIKKQVISGRSSFYCPKCQV